MIFWPRFLLLAGLVVAAIAWPHLWKWLRNTPSRDRRNSDI